MSLVGDGALPLDTPTRALPGDGLPLVDPAVTVRHLLTHNSGIGDYLDEDAGTVSDHVLPVPVHRLARARDDLEVLDGHLQAFPPGAAVRLLQRRLRRARAPGGVEPATGRDYHDLVAERVLAPAGMADTAFLRSDRLPRTAAPGYLDDDDGGGWRTNVLHLPVRGVGDGGAHSTAGDMAWFWSAFLDGRIVPPAGGRPVDSPAGPLGAGRPVRFRLLAHPGRRTALLEGYDAGISFSSAADRDPGPVCTVVSNTSEGAWPVADVVEAALATAP